MKDSKNLAYAFWDLTTWIDAIPITSGAVFVLIIIFKPFTFGTWRGE